MKKREAHVIEYKNKAEEAWWYYTSCGSASRLQKELKRLSESRDSRYEFRKREGENEL